MKQSDLINAIRAELTEKCSGRALDDEADFEVVMEVIAGTVKSYLKNRCEGCR
jgi:hypothetical protein